MHVSVRFMPSPPHFHVYSQQNASPIGLGALSSPLVATQFARMRRWSFHYFISLGLSCGAIIAVSLAFRFKDQLCTYCDSQIPESRVIDVSLADCLRQIGQEPEQKPEQVPITLRSLVWDNKTLPILTVFLFFYVGTEISMAGACEPRPSSLFSSS